MCELRVGQRRIVLPRIGGTLVVFAALCVLSPAAAYGVLRTCGPDPVANTATVLCAPTSGPCTATSVAMSENIEVTSGGCAFDLGGRTLSIQKTFQMTGLGFIIVTNAGSITIASTGQLKARGDYVKPNGFIIEGGTIALTSAGTITHAGTIDVTGDGAGTIQFDAVGDVVLQSGSVIQGNGVSSFADEGERYADGGIFEVMSRTGNITVGATVTIRGGNQAIGGLMDLEAARNVAVNGAVDATGGGGDGGDIAIAAGDHVTITKKIDVSSRLGGGYGGTMTVEAGVDVLGGVTPGGTLTVNDTAIELNGADAETFGGDGGELDMSAVGHLMIIGSRAAIRASGGTLFDGSGGAIYLDSGDAHPNSLGPSDGDLVVQGQVVARSGGLGGDGGVFEASAGNALTLTAPITVTGKDTGGDVVGDAGGAVTLDGTINAGATNTLGDGGFVDFVAGLAADATITVSRDVLAAGGSSSGGGQSITLAGCGLTVSDGVKVNGQGGVTATGVPGGSDIDLIARRPMQLRANSQYLADPAGRITTIHPPGQNPVIGAGVVFNPARIDIPTTNGFYPNCPVCGDGIRQAGEVCDKGAGADGACCNATCTAFTCPTPTRTATPTPAGTGVTPTATPSATPGVTGTATVTPTVGATPATTSTRTPTATAANTRTATPTAAPTPQPAVLDHFKCYKARPQSGTPGFVERTVTLADGFESKITTVVKTTLFCNPVDKDGVGITDPTAHLQCYKIKDVAGQPRFEAQEVEVENEFGVQPLLLKKAQHLCVPSERDGQPSALNLDDFKCYAARKPRGEPAFVRRTVALADAFETKLTTVLRPTNVCNSASMNGAGVRSPGSELHCYKIKDADGQPRFSRRSMASTNQLGSEQLSAQKARLVCLPSAMDIPPVCGDGRLDPGEECDDGNTVSGDGCDSSCRVESCGNGRIDAGEECDPPQGPQGCPLCTADCQLGPNCGNGLTEASCGEQCDDGNQNPCDGCTGCQVDRCGDGVRCSAAGEQCDDGNSAACDGCSPTCVAEICGDGVVCASQGEECDAAAANGLDNCCSETCALVDPDGDGICNRDDICPADVDNDSDGDRFCRGEVFNPPAIGGGDPCSRTGGAGTWIKPKAVFKKLAAPAGDEKLTLKGQFVIAGGGPALAPDKFGVHVRVIDGAKQLIVDERIPGTEFRVTGFPVGWKVGGDPPKKWLYLDKASVPPAQNGILKVLVTDRSGREPGLVKVAVVGKLGTYALAPGQEPLTVTVELNDTGFPAGGAPGTDKCGEAVFVPAPGFPSCTFAGRPEGDRLTCK